MALPSRERVLRTLTFWLRPAFLLRAVNRFQRIAGFDRAVALASSALTALIPLAVVSGAVLTSIGGEDLADRIIERYELTGGGAEAVEDAFSPAGGTRRAWALSGRCSWSIAVLSFTRAMQRLFEQTWELDALSVRNTLNGLRWAAALVGLRGGHRMDPRARGPRAPRAGRVPAHGAADRGLPRLERLDPQREADRLAGCCCPSA